MLACLCARSSSRTGRARAAAGRLALSTSATAAGPFLWSSRCTLPGGPPRASRSHSQPRSDTQPCSQRFAYGCNLFLSIARPPELARYSLGRSRLRFVPVFSSHADLDSFARLYGQASVAHGMVVNPGPNPNPNPNPYSNPNPNSNPN